MRELFSASSCARNDTEILESESVKYDAFMDLILMLAVLKADVSTNHQQQDSRDLVVVGEEEES